MWRSSLVVTWLCRGQLLLLVSQEEMMKMAGRLHPPPPAASSEGLRQRQLGHHLIISASRQSLVRLWSGEVRSGRE